MTPQDFLKTATTTEILGDLGEIRVEEVINLSKEWELDQFPIDSNFMRQDFDVFYEANNKNLFNKLIEDEFRKESGLISLENLNSSLELKKESSSNDNNDDCSTSKSNEKESNSNSISNSTSNSKKLGLGFGVERESIMVKKSDLDLMKSVQESSSSPAAKRQNTSSSSSEVKIVVHALAAPHFCPWRNKKGVLKKGRRVKPISLIS